MITKSFPGAEGRLMYGRRRTETRSLLMCFSVAILLGGAWAVDVQAETSEYAQQAPDPCPRDSGEPCCDRGPRGNPDEEGGIDEDCPAGRSHRRGGGGPGDTVADDGPGGEGAGDGRGDTVRDGNHARDDGGSFGSGGNLRRGRGGRGAPAGSITPRTPGGAGGGPVSGPGGGTTGGSPGRGSTGGLTGPGAAGGSTPAPGTAAVSSPGARFGSGTPAGTSGPAVSGSTSNAPQGAGAGQPSRTMARTGPDIATPLGLAMTLLVAGTSLRRASRPCLHRRVECRRGVPRRPGRHARRPEPAPPRWSYVDRSAAARAIEKF